MKPILEERAKASCTKYVKLYEACAERVRSKGEGDCQGQYWDLYHCIDKITAPKIFANLK